MLRSTCVLVVLLASTASARAEHAKSWPFARLSLLMGDRNVGALETKRDGFAFALGLGRRSFALYGELQLTDQHVDGLQGLGTDVALHVRRTIHSIDFGGAIVGCWADASVGMQRFDSSTGSFHRPAFSFGLGGGGLFYEDHKVDGLELELRLEAAPATSPATIQRCTGACSQTAGTDFGVQLLASYPFSL